jgi:hypothetical protein
MHLIQKRTCAMTFTFKNYHYYLIGGFSFVLWIFAVVFALETAVNLAH